ncbi:hypothetical protein ACC785_38250, partial [Rhizobium ruizarguesonis]
LSTTQLQGVVEAVRNAILYWALSLERAGIKGEGFSFDTTERTKALTGSITYNINSIGSFGLATISPAVFSAPMIPLNDPM